MSKKKVITEEIIDDGQAIETPQTPDTPVEKDIQIDENQLREDIKSQVYNELMPQIQKEAYDKITQDFLTKLQGTQKEDEPETISQKLVKKYGDNPNADQAWEFIVEEATSKMRTAQELERKAQEDKSRQDEEALKQSQAYWQSKWDREYEGLVEMGAMPKVEKPTETEDPATKARFDLFTKFSQVVQDAQKEGKAPPESLFEIYHRYYQPNKRGVAGADAPVSGGTAVVGGARPRSVRDIPLNKLVEEALYGSQGS